MSSSWAVEGDKSQHSEGTYEISSVCQKESLPLPLAEGPCGFPLTYTFGCTSQPTLQQTGFPPPSYSSPFSTLISTVLSHAGHCCLVSLVPAISCVFQDSSRCLCMFSVLSIKKETSPNKVTISVLSLLYPLNTIIIIIIKDGQTWSCMV